MFKLDKKINNEIYHDKCPCHVGGTGGSETYIYWNIKWFNLFYNNI